MKATLVGFLTVLIFLGTSVGAYTVTNVFATENPSAPDNGGRSIVVPTPEDAEQIAGYEAANPSFLPEDFGRGSITVRLPFEDSPEAHHTITQYWGSPTGEVILLIQNPDLDGIIGGKPDTVAGVTGERAIYPPRGSRRHEMIGFFWREGNMSYAISGSLTGSLTESDVRQVADSIKLD